jgi:hypothetical protein
MTHAARMAEVQAIASDIVALAQSAARVTPGSPAHKPVAMVAAVTLQVIETLHVALPDDYDRQAFIAVLMTTMARDMGGVVMR